MRPFWRQKQADKNCFFTNDSLDARLGYMNLFPYGQPDSWPNVLAPFVRPGAPFVVSDRSVRSDALFTTRTRPTNLQDTVDVLNYTGHSGTHTHTLTLVFS